jgi:uncharacterized protein YyaL (SSP411 family)
MNDWFVNIKVDREERPDVDEVYMRAVQLLTGRGGWPMTVFLTPERKPFYGGTYYPPTDRHGMPGFPRVLEAVMRAYRERPDDIAKSVDQLLAGLASLDAPTAQAGELDRALSARATEALLGHFDSAEGGLGGAPKFPHPQAFQLFLRQYRVTRKAAFREAVMLTCERMAQGGMYDQIGGGFHRYAVDARWRVPHFEKMLYDNAQIPRLYLEAYQVTGEAWLARIVEETLAYVLRDLRHPDGAIYSATDADSEGEEGKYFVWTPAEVAQVVDPADQELVCRYWDITEDGNFEGKNIPRVALSEEQAAKLFRRPPAEVTAALARARAALLTRRAERVPPLRDEKVIVSWNALMIGTLAEAGRVLGREDFIAAARQAADFIWSQLRRDGRLLHGWAAGKAKQGGFLDDHAFLANALVDLYEATGERVHLTRAHELVTALETRFRDEAAGGFFFTAHDEEQLIARIARSKSGADGSVPSGIAVAAHVLLRLQHLTGEDRYAGLAEEILRLFHDEAARNPFGYASYFQALEFSLEGPTEVVVVSRPGAGDAKALWSEVSRTYLPHRVLVQGSPGDGDPLAPARDRPAVDGRATAYLCRNRTCSAPVTEPSALRALLEGPW